MGVDRPYYVIFELQRTDYQRSASYVTLTILHTPVAGKENFNELRTVCSFSHSLRSFLFWGKYVKDFSAMRTPQRTSYYVKYCEAAFMTAQGQGPEGGPCPPLHGKGLVKPYDKVFVIIN